MSENVTEQTVYVVQCASQTDSGKWIDYWVGESSIIASAVAIKETARDDTKIIRVIRRQIREEILMQSEES